MQEEIEVLKQYVESLGLHEKEEFTLDDKNNLAQSLRDADENTLANYVDKLPFVSDLRTLIKDTLYT